MHPIDDLRTSDSVGWSRQQRFLLAITVVAFSAATAAHSSTQPKSPASDSAPKVTHVLGLGNVNHNARGKLTVDAGGLEFQGSDWHAQVAIASIEDIFTSEDSRQSGGKVLTVAKIGIPYGGSRVLSMFTHEKFATLTVTYRDDNHGLHGALFTTSSGQAHDIKKQLVAQGAHTSVPMDEGVLKEKK